MAKSKKTKKIAQVVDPIGEIKLTQERYEQCEWCFQFDEDEPQIFAWTNDGDLTQDPILTFTVSNVKDSYITFQNSKTGKVFKLFARELTNEGKDLRNKQNESIKSNLQNESTNKEA
jgi:hypothetical protein